MNPFFTTGDQIVRETVRRHNAREAGEEVNTPGIGALRYMPPPGSVDKYSREQSGAHMADVARAGAQSPSRPRTPRRAAVRPSAALSDDKRQAIVNGHAAGFTTLDLAGAFGLDESVIKEVVGK